MARGPRFAVVVGALVALSGLPGCGRKVLDLGKVESESAADAGARDAGRRDSGAALRDAAAAEHPCTREEDCAEFHEVCVFDKGHCGECTEKTQPNRCTQPRASLCEPTTNECVECIDDGDCGGGVCNPAVHTCTLPCTADGCFPNPLGVPVGVCDNGYCAICRDDTQCAAFELILGPSFSKCNRGTCAECVTDSDCGSRFPRCGPRGHCQE